MTKLGEAIKDLIEGGFVGRAVIGTLIWVLIAFLILRGAEFNDRLWDAGFVVIGYLFHVTTSAAQARSLAKLQRRMLVDCPPETLDIPEAQQ